MPYKSVIRVAVGTGLILLIPLVLTVFGIGGWNWRPGGFVVAGVMLFGTGLALDFVVRKVRNPAYRVAACAAIVLAFLAVWVELAVDGVSQALAWLLGLAATR